MRKISIWGRNNPGLARIVIAVSFLFLMMLAIMLGLLGYMNEVRISSGIGTGNLLLFFILYLFYPMRHARWKILRHSYARQKSHDFLLVFSTFFLFGGLTNQFAYEPITIEVRQPLVKTVVYKINEKPDIQNPIVTRKSVREALKTQVKNIRIQIKEWKRAKRDTNDKTGLIVLKIFLVLLTLAAAVGAFIGIAALSCSLSCSGNEGAAVLVLVGGIVVISFLMVLAIRGIVRMKLEGKEDVSYSAKSKWNEHQKDSHLI